jgi:hypothetical protein
VLRQRLTFLNVEVIYRCQGHSAAGACPAPASIGAMYLEACVEDRFFDLGARQPGRARVLVVSYAPGRR